MRRNACNAVSIVFVVFVATALLALLAVAQAQSSANANSGPAKPASRTCKIVHTVASDGDLDLARKDYDAAAIFYRAALAQSPTSQEARLGLVRSLIGEDNTAEAISAAQDALAQDPKSALAELAAAEADFRAADFVSAREHAIHASVDDDCEGRVFAFAARLNSLFANFSRASLLLATAHQLRPDDELIRREWIRSLPRQQRLAELQSYLEHHPAVSDEDRNLLSISADYLKARRPGECRITSKSDSTKVPFVPIYGDAPHPVAYGLKVVFNGKARDMQIDTGASGIILSPGAARSLGLQPEYRLQAGGVGDSGKVDSYLTHVATIRIGDVELSDCMVEVLQKSYLDSDGLIGMDVFSRWLVTLDYPNATLLLNPLPARPAAAGSSAAIPEDDAPHDAFVPPAMQNWLHVARIGHDLLLPSVINGGPVHYLMADTGASQTTLSLAFARQSGKPHLDDNVHFKGISGEVKKVYRLDDAGLQFGTLRLPPSSYFAFDFTKLSHDTGTEVSGLFGLPSLARLTITVDYRDNLMQLKYDPKHDPALRQF
jgi:predicted aspartyl protease